MRSIAEPKNKWYLFDATFEVLQDQLLVDDLLDVVLVKHDGNYPPFSLVDCKPCLFSLHTNCENLKQVKVENCSTINDETQKLNLKILQVSTPW